MGGLLLLTLWAHPPESITVYTFDNQPVVLERRFDTLRIDESDPLTRLPGKTEVYRRIDALPPEECPNGDAGTWEHTVVLGEREVVETISSWGGCEGERDPLFDRVVRLYQRTPWPAQLCVKRRWQYSAKAGTLEIEDRCDGTVAVSAELVDESIDLTLSGDPRRGRFQGEGFQMTHPPRSLAASLGWRPGAETAKLRAVVTYTDGAGATEDFDFRPRRHTATFRLAQPE